MRPGPIPDDAIWDGARRVVVAAPDGDLMNPVIAPVEAVIDYPASMSEYASLGDPVPCFNIRCVLDPGDLAKLAQGGHVWLSFYGGLPVFSVDVTGPDGR